jgi:hypothetical protein
MTTYTAPAAARLLVLLAVLATAMTSPAVAMVDGENTSGCQSALAEWGIEILGVHTSAAGNLLDLRYRVVDASKAEVLFKGAARPRLLDDSTGAALIVPNPPKVGALRSKGQPKVGHNYFMLFGNPGHLVKPGGLVTLVVGDLRAEHLVVE